MVLNSGPCFAYNGLFGIFSGSPMYALHVWSHNLYNYVKRSPFRTQILSNILKNNVWTTFCLKTGHLTRLR